MRAFTILSEILNKTTMKNIILILIFFLSTEFLHSQKRLLSWSQSNIENYTKEMYDEAQKLSINQLLEKNKNVQSIYAENGQIKFNGRGGSKNVAKYYN